MREPPDAYADVDIDGTGHVLLNRKGLSVTENWRDLPGHLIPEHLDDGFNGASGRGMNVFAHGTGTFDEGEITEALELRHKTGTITAGVVTPTASVLLAEYQQTLAATRPDWIIDET